MKGGEEDRNRKMIENVICEVQTMSQFKKEEHPYIVNLIEYDKEGIIEKAHKPKRQAFYIVLELAQGGELFDFVASTGAFPEAVARYYFRQLMEGLDSVHRKGITHRDLKPENLLYDADFNLKIADFGFAAPLAGRDGSSLQRTILGTFGYMAPEIFIKDHNHYNGYNGAQVDLFASAIILFIMVAGHPPFNRADPQKD